MLVIIFSIVVIFVAVVTVRRVTFEPLAIVCPSEVSWGLRKTQGGKRSFTRQNDLVVATESVDVKLPVRVFVCIVLRSIWIDFFKPTTGLQWQLLCSIDA